MKTIGMDTSPRRIWFGLRIPGKKMVAFFDTEDEATNRESLIHAYQSSADSVLHWVARLLHALSSADKTPIIVPEWREGGVSVIVARIHRLILADMRDFLRFRFRARGQSDMAAIAKMVDEDDTLSTDEALVISKELNSIIDELDQLAETAGFSTLEGFRRATTLVKGRLVDLTRVFFPGPDSIWEKYCADLDSFWIE